MSLLSNKIVLFACLLLIAVTSKSYGQIRSELNDGPYVFQVGDSLSIQWVEAGQARDTILSCEDATLFERPNLPNIDLRNLDFIVKREYAYKADEKVLALSDVHGQYDLMVQLLQAHNVIDADLNWSLGKGCLVVVGDNMDRGDKVLDILWLLFKLEKQAQKEGGMVHVLLGNHEIMVLNGDLRYLNKKYYYTSAVLKTRYDRLFRVGSILGDWIASQQVVISVNNVLYLHGGISPLVLDMKMSLNKINKIFSNDLIRKSKDDIVKDEKKSNLFFEEGPLWYRGYFGEENLPLKELETTLKKLKVEKIVVGHTSLDVITPLYEGRVIGIDCSIKLGLNAQLLIIDNGKPYVGDLSGNRRLIDGKKGAIENSIFTYIQNLETPPDIEIVTDVNALINNDSEEIYQPVLFILKSDSDLTMVDIRGEIRTRGRSRKSYCEFPPVKFNFSKSTLNSMGFLALDKLKVVLPCTMDSSAFERLYKEYLLYDIYQSLIDKDALKSTLVNIELKDSMTQEKGNVMPGFLVEDDTEFIYSRGGKIIEMGLLSAMDFDRKSFMRMYFFQYMIANTDWGIENRNNILALQLSENSNFKAIPFDFDFAGFVNQPYAIPDGSLPIKTIHDRHFMNYPMNEKEFNDVVDFYLSIEDAVYTKCDQAPYLSSLEREKSKLYLKGFFEAVEDRSTLKRKLLK
ncbi:MAG: hypothetical protein ACJA01_001597 [Saprospiraceae bacterium]